jgi:hypothetical protein
VKAAPRTALGLELKALRPTRASASLTQNVLQAPSILAFHEPIPNKNMTFWITIPAVHHANAKDIMPKRDFSR